MMLYIRHKIYTVGILIQHMLFKFILLDFASSVHFTILWWTAGCPSFYLY